MEVHRCKERHYRTCLPSSGRSNERKYSVTKRFVVVKVVVMKRHLGDAKGLAFIHGLQVQVDKYSFMLLNVIGRFE